MNKTTIFAISLILAFCVSCISSSDTTDGHTSSCLLRVQIGDKYGFINEHGDIVIEPQFDLANQFSEGLCFAQLEEKKGYIDENGTFKIELPDSIIWSNRFQHGIATVISENGSYSAVNNSGRYLFDRFYDHVYSNPDMGNIYFTIKDNHKWSMTDSLGETIGTPCDSIHGGFNQGLCAVMIDGKWGYMDTDGEIKIKPIYDSAKTFSSEGLARVQKGNTYYLIDKTGEEIFSADTIFTGVECNRAVVSIDSTLYLVDGTGKKIKKINADKVMSGFQQEDSLATIFRKGKTIKIDTNGNDLLSTKHDNIGTFINGIAPAVKNGKIGFINRTGKEIIPIEHDYLELFDGIIVTYSDNCTKYYDFKGNIIGKDMPTPKVTIPEKPSKEDFIKFFDSRLADLDPIEGVYYVTIKNYYEDRDNTDKYGLNKSKSEFYAIIKDPSCNEYHAYCADESGESWVNKFVKIGNSNNYAIMKIDRDNKYSSEGKMTLDDPVSFSFRLELNHNSGYNFFVVYEFEKDYPSTSEYEKLQKAEWTGSGFAIADGYIATNYHVTSGAKSIRIRGINGDMEKSYKAVVIASDKEHDLSIVRIVDKDFKSLGSIPYSLGKQMVDVGDNVFVLGYPIVSAMGNEVKLTEGIISAASGYQGDKSMFQISAAVQPGNSGGPLFNEDGIAIGVVCGKLSDAENANYAIKISYLYSLINSSDLGINLPENSLSDKQLSKKVKKIRDYVYLIECSSK